MGWAEYGTDEAVGGRVQLMDATMKEYIRMMPLGWRLRRLPFRFIRWLVGLQVRLLVKTPICKTFGDIAELSPGPCERCVGHAVYGTEQQ